MDFDNPSPELTSKILEHVKKSGFPLEWEVRDSLKKMLSKLPNDLHSFGVESHGDYLDPQENIYREFDLSTFVRSTGSGGAPNIYWNQYFECKQSDKNSWIFFTEPKEKYYQESMWTASSVNLRYLRMIPSLYSKNPEKLLGGPIHYGRHSHQAFSFIGYPDNTDTSIKSAIYQVLKPLYAHFTKVSKNIIQRKQKIDKDIHLWFPVIVYLGNLFEFRYSGNGGQLIPSKHILLESNLLLGNNNLPSTYLVDIVRFDYLDEYLEQQYSDYKLLKDYVTINKPERREIPEVVLYI